MISLQSILDRIYRHYVRIDRMWIVWHIVVCITCILVGTTLRYTVYDHSMYTDLADGQQTMTITNPLSRGTIYSNSPNPSLPRGVMWVSTNLGTLAIDPSQTGSQAVLSAFLADLVYGDICTSGSDIRPSRVCTENISLYTRTDIETLELVDRASALEYIATYLQQKMSTPIDSVQIQKTLTPVQIQAIEALADSGVYMVSDNLYVNPSALTDKEKTANILGRILDVPAETVLPRLAVRTRRHLEILHRMTIRSRDMVKKRILADRVSVAQKTIPDTESIYKFFKVEDNLVRFYPEEYVGGQIVGFVDPKGQWQYGIEWYWNNELQWDTPTRTLRKDSSGRPIWGYTIAENTAKNGVELTLTIDRNIEKKISEILEKSVLSFRANKWSVIVMDPKTGDIIAMVNYPHYNPNDYTAVYDMEKVMYNRYPNPAFDLLGYPLFVEDSASGSQMMVGNDRISLRPASEEEVGNGSLPKYKYKNGFGPWVYVNDVMGSIYEPGSVFKAITVAIGIDSGEIKPTDTYYDKGYVEIDTFKIKNVSSTCLGRNTYIHALNWSCNVGMIDIVQKTGKNIFYKYIMDFGFGTKSNINMDGEVYSKIDAPDKWSRTKLFTMSFGQGISVTMLQMAVAYSAIANGGIYMEPHIISSITYPDGRTYDTPPNPLRRVIKEETSKKVIAMLVDGVRRGFAAKGWVPGWDIAGKTGTSQIAAKGWYEVGTAGHTITSYGGFAPANDPKFVLIVRVERPRSSVYSETTSSALFAQIAAYLLDYYKIPKN